MSLKGLACPDAIKKGRGCAYLEAGRVSCSQPGRGATTCEEAMFRGKVVQYNLTADQNGAFVKGETNP